MILDISWNVFLWWVAPPLQKLWGNNSTQTYILGRDANALLLCVNVVLKVICKRKIINSLVGLVFCGDKNVIFDKQTKTR